MIVIKDYLVAAFQGLESLLEVYREVDEVIHSFRQSASLECFPQCRECCRKPAGHIEATVFEMIPMSIHIWQQGRGDEFLARLESVGPDEVCLLLRGDDEAPDQGGCTEYMWRPLVCRLFGFSAVTGRHDEIVLSMCRKMKENNPLLGARVQEMIRSGLNVPVNSFFALRVSQLNLFWTQKRYSVNEALKIALEVVGYRMSLNNEPGQESDRTLPPGRPRSRRPA